MYTVCTVGHVAFSPHDFPDFLDFAECNRTPFPSMLPSFFCPFLPSSNCATLQLQIPEYSSKRGVAARRDISPYHWHINWRGGWQGLPGEKGPSSQTKMRWNVQTQWGHWPAEKWKKKWKLAGGIRPQPLGYSDMYEYETHVSRPAKLRFPPSIVPSIVPSMTSIHPGEYKRKRARERDIVTQVHTYIFSQ